MTKNNIYIIKYCKHISNKKLIEMPKNEINLLILKEKKELLKYISFNIGKNITSVKSLFLDSKLNFGNQFLLLNKAIFFCEFLGCKRIILNENYFWYIKNKIIYKKFNMLIKVGNKKNIKYRGTIIDGTLNFFYYSNYIKPEYRANILKSEIIKNLPLTKVYDDDLFIYIRSGDIFILPNKYYSQPPFCFYKEILNNFKFKNIYIIAENKNNPVINKLINQFPKIIYNENSLKIDISYLIKAYNIVKAPSTLIESIIQLNNNLKILFDFDFDFKKKTNFLDEFINSINNKKRTIKVYKMKSLEKYTNQMLFWNNSQSQRDLMLNIDCINKFNIFFNK